MATKVLRPQEIPAFNPNRRRNLYRNPPRVTGNRKPEQKTTEPAVKTETVNQRTEIRPVTILKRGEMIVSTAKKSDVRSDLYAGSTISMSPSPRSLPLPSFFSKKQISEDFATRDLRRLLRLD